MNTKEKQDALMTVISDDKSLNLLYDCWVLLQRAPDRAAEILMQFRDVTASAKTAAADIQDAINRFELLKPRMVDLEEFATRLLAFNKVVSNTHEEHVLNRLNRLIKTAEEIAALRKTGSFEILEKLLKP